MSTLKFASIPQKRLLQGITPVSTSFYLNNILSFDGENNVSAADLGSIHYCCFRNDTGSVVEFMEIDPSTLIAGGAITINKRGLSFYGDLTTQTTALKLDWPTNSIVMLGTDVSQIFQWLKEYIDGIAIAGAPNASTTAKGLAEEATQAEVDAGTAAGATGARLFINPSTHRGRAYNDYAADSVGTDSYAITVTPAVTAYAEGQIFTFKAGTANTGPATLNVSGLGAKTIKKNVSSDLETGDILQNQIVMVEYDASGNFQILSISSIAPAKTDVQSFTGNGTWTKPAGAKSVKVIVKGGGGSGASGDARAFTTNNNVLGGGGGGGGAFIEGSFEASELPSTIAVTVGAQVAGGTAVVSSGTGNVAGNDGTDGNLSSFGSYLVANGGKKGLKTSGGGGAGGFVTGFGTSVTLTSATAILGQGGTAPVGASGKSSESGGGGGGDASDTEPAAGSTGGGSIFGSGGGGGGGAATTNGNAPTAGGAGGQVLSYSVGGGGPGGAAGDDADATAGTGGAQTGHCSSGGGGGGASGRNAAGANAGGAGGAGGTPGGGGGGGGAAGGVTGTTMTSGAGGFGARGEVIVITYF